MLALGMTQDMILASGTILAGHALVFLLLQAVFTDMFLQFLWRFVVAITMFALHK